MLTTCWAHWTGPGADLILLALVPYVLMSSAVLAAILRCAPGPARRLLVLVYAVPLLELAFRRLLFGVTWTLAGQPLVEYPPLAQLASVTGPEGLSLLALAIAAGLYGAVQPRMGRARYGLMAHGGVLLAVALSIGAAHSNWTAARDPIRIAVVQPVVSQTVRWTPQNRGPMLAKLDGLIDSAAAQRPALIVLPEAAIPGQVRFDPALAAFVKGAVERTRLPMLFGSMDHAGTPPRFYNAAFMITPFGDVTTYRKIRLVPFVEYFPGGLRLWSEFPDFTPGSERTSFSLPQGLQFATAICFEDTLPNLAREFAADGSEALIALVNTQNFDGTPQGLQHLRRARLTAISVGLPMLRAANSGISASIDSRGRMVRALPPARPAAAVLELPLDARSTFYAKHGDAPVALLLASAIAVLCGIRGRPGRRSRST